jgi:Fructosamine kinase
MGPVQSGAADRDFAMTSISPSCDHYGARLPLTFGLLHGDLWGGNILVTGDQVSGLIDPACYHGHTEVDLAMLGLFDQPNAAFCEAYGLLEPGHDERTPINLLWPAFVRLRLFVPATGLWLSGYYRRPAPDLANSTSPLNTMRDLPLLCNATASVFEAIRVDLLLPRKSTERSKRAVPL